MNLTKCPFCGKPIRYLGTDLFTCDKCHIMLPAKHWLAYINTRKALDVVAKKVEALKELADIAGFGMFSAGCQDIIEQIPLTTLEQKD